MLNAQQYIKTVKVYNKNTNFDFTNEWQYVSTDLYLFNSQKFNYLINRINPEASKSMFKKKNNDQIKNIMVTTQLDGMGDLDKLTYPIFNFIVTTDDKGELNVQTSEPEVIKIVDNVPVSSINNSIGAKIQVSIYSDKNRSDIYKFIATQLQTAAGFTSLTTTDVALKVVGEIGNMMQKDAAGKQYQFESTIRFYEENNFDRKLHSITIFLFQPSYYISSNFDTTGISALFDTSKCSVIDKSTIESIVNYPLLPYMVAVNYRSKYKAEISDEINFDMLKVRAEKNENNYKNGVVSRDIYLQEKSLIDFLNIFAQLQLDISNYELNYKAKITEDFTIHLFLILQDFWNLKNSFKIISKEFEGNPLYENEFKPLYNRYLTQANLKFESNSSLRGVREHVETLYYLENYGTNGVDSVKMEDFLRKMKSNEFPPREYNSDEATITRHWISTIENELFLIFFKPHIDLIENMPVDDKSNELSQKLVVHSSNSYCDLCRSNVQSFSEKYAVSYSNYKYIEYQKVMLETKNIAQAKSIDYSKKQTCIQQNLDNSNSNRSEHLQIIQNILNDISEKRDLLFILLDNEIEFENYQEIIDYTNELNLMMFEIETNFDLICKSNPELCECE